MTLTFKPVETAIAPMTPAVAAPPRAFSFQHLATLVLTTVGFIALFQGLTHMLNGSSAFAFVLAFVIQGLTVTAIHNYKRARASGGAFRLFRGVPSLTLYAMLALVIVTFSYSFYYRLTRAERAATEIFTAQKQSMLGKLAAVNSRYQTLSPGLQSLGDAADAREKDEAARGNTCRIASPRGAGPIRNFRRQDAVAFKEYAALIQSNVEEVSGRIAAVRVQSLGKGEVKETQAQLNDMSAHINASLIANPMLMGVLQFIDGRLRAGDNIDYYGRTIKCEDEQRTAQLISSKLAAQAILKEPPLPPVKLFDPSSVQENALLAANRIAALGEWAASFFQKNLSDLDPSIADGKLSTRGKVYIHEDYLSLLFALSIEVALFFVVPVPVRDTQRRALIDGLAQGIEPISWRNVRKLAWLALSAPVDEGAMADLSEFQPLKRPGNFLLLRPYLVSFKHQYFLVIPHAPHTARIHDFAEALVLKNHAKPILDQRLAVGDLPSSAWVERLQCLLAPHHGFPDWDWSVPLPADTLDAINSVPVRVLAVSRAFFAFMITRAVEMDEDELIPEPPLGGGRARAASI